MKDIVKLNLNLTVEYEMGADYDPTATDFGENDYNFDLQRLKDNLQGLVTLGIREGLFTEDTYAYMNDHKVVITEMEG